MALTPKCHGPFVVSEHNSLQSVVNVIESTIFISQRTIFVVELLIMTRIEIGVMSLQGHNLFVLNEHIEIPSSLTPIGNTTKKTNSLNNVPSTKLLNTFVLVRNIKQLHGNNNIDQMILCNSEECPKFYKGEIV